MSGWIKTIDNKTFTAEAREAAPPLDMGRMTFETMCSSHGGTSSREPRLKVRDLWDLWCSCPSWTFLIRDLSAPASDRGDDFRVSSENITKTFGSSTFYHVRLPNSMCLKEAWLGSCPVRKAANSLNIFQPRGFCTYCWTNVLLQWWQDCEQRSCVSDSLCGASYHKHKRLNDMLLMNTHTHTFSLEEWTNQQQQQRCSTVRLFLFTHLFYYSCWLCCRCDHVTVCVERVDVRRLYFERTSTVSPTRFKSVCSSKFHQKWILKISQSIFYEAR